jgi:thiol-disulfide isomerase/thioredoxin
MLKYFCSLAMIFAIHSSFGQTTIVKFEDVEKLIKTPPNEKIQVINFWATWCAPCVKELPLFEKINTEQSAGVSVTLVSLDFADQVEKVNSFITRKKLQSPVILLDNIDYNSWIDRVDTNWSGAIPATLIINPKTGHRKFIGKELKEGELEEAIKELR